MKNAQVAKFWHSGVPASSRSGNYRTDGLDLFSYKRKIGFTNGYGQKVVINYTNAPGGQFVSSTTSNHVNLAKFYADIFENVNLEH